MQAYFDLLQTFEVRWGWIIRVTPPRWWPLPPTAIFLTVLVVAVLCVSGCQIYWDPPPDLEPNVGTWHVDSFGEDQTCMETLWYYTKAAFGGLIYPMIGDGWGDAPEVWKHLEVN
jgi:hypothetical protein